MTKKIRIADLPDFDPATLLKDDEGFTGFTGLHRGRTWITA